MLNTAVVLFAAAVAAQTATPAPSQTSAAAAEITSVSECHNHGTVQYCMVGTSEFQVLVTATDTEALPTSYSGCHAHGSDELWCITEDGGEVQLLAEGAEAGTPTNTAVTTEPTADSEGENCHFHAGVEHCVGHGESESGTSVVSANGTVTVVAPSCERRDREYNKNLRIGLIFVMLATSIIAVFGPMVLANLFSFDADHFALVVIRQFGTGVIISTAFVHLFTHANFMFENECLGNLAYESTTAAIVMAGIFLSFLIEYFAHRFLHSRQAAAAAAAAHTHNHTTTVGADKETQTDSSRDGSQSPPLINEHQKNKAAALNAVVLESGILFHSLLIGITLVVAGDSVFGTLFAVIVFHQMFEGVALGSIIAGLRGISFFKKLIMGAAFSVVTPIGMGIGVGVLGHFNGNDPSTLIALGTLNALSAGILVWVGVVEMWAKDWMHGPLATSGVALTACSLMSLIAGMVLMSFLGKWA